MIQQDIKVKDVQSEILRGQSFGHEDYTWFRLLSHSDLHGSWTSLNFLHNARHESSLPQGSVVHQEEEEELLSGFIRTVGRSSCFRTLLSFSEAAVVDCRRQLMESSQLSPVRKSSPPPFLSVVVGGRDAYGNSSGDETTVLHDVSIREPYSGTVAAEGFPCASLVHVLAGRGSVSHHYDPAAQRDFTEQDIKECVHNPHIQLWYLELHLCTNTKVITVAVKSCIFESPLAANTDTRI